MAMTSKKGLLIVVSGPSGAGKGTICEEFMKTEAENTCLSVSATTRAARPGETEGVHYYFLSEEKFKRLIAEDGLIEWACFCGNYYGTPKKKVTEAIAAGKNVILEIEVQGAMKVRSEFPEAVFVYVIPPSMSELRKRLSGRATESDEVIGERLKTAAWEFSHIAKYNYILLNDDVDKAVERLKCIITAEGQRVERNVDYIKEVVEN